MKYIGPSTFWAKFRRQGLRALSIHCTEHENAVRVSNFVFALAI
jgi:hypothetical protein